MGKKDLQYFLKKYIRNNMSISNMRNTILLIGLFLIVIGVLGLIVMYILLWEYYFKTFMDISIVSASLVIIGVALIVFSLTDQKKMN